MKKEITKDMTIEEILMTDESLGEVLLGFGMHCIYCPMGRMESLEEACHTHNVDLDFMLKKLNEVLNFSVKGAIKSEKKVKKAKLN